MVSYQEMQALLIGVVLRTEHAVILFIIQVLRNLQPYTYGKIVIPHHDFRRSGQVYAHGILERSHFTTYRIQSKFHTTRQGSILIPGFIFGRTIQRQIEFQILHDRQRFGFKLTHEDTPATIIFYLDALWRNRIAWTYGVQFHIPIKFEGERKLSWRRVGIALPVHIVQQFSIIGHYACHDVEVAK